MTLTYNGGMLSACLRHIRPEPLAMLTRCLRFFAVSALAALAVSVPVAAHHPGDGQVAATDVAGVATVTLTGTVDQLVVVDRVNATTQRYPILRQGDGSKVALRGDAVQAIEAGAHVAVTGSQTGTMFTVSGVESGAAQPRSAQVSKAARAQVAGKFMVAHADNFETGTSQFFYQVFDEQGGVTDIAMPFLPGSLATGMQVVVDGTLAFDGTRIDPDSISILSTFTPSAATATTNYLVIPIKFPISGAGTLASPWVYNADPFTVASLNTAVFGDLPTKSAKEFYKETSYGQQLLGGATADNGSGGFLLANAATPPCTNYGGIATAAANAARLRGYPIDASGNPLAPYTGLLYVFNGVPGCGWAGLAYVGWARAWSNNTSALWVIGHELGHNFGLLHAGSLRCTGVAIGCGAAASVAEYGDPFSSMGNSSNTGHFNATQKDILGWITPTQTKTHASGTATYTLSPIETGGLATYAVRIPTTNANRTYWIEYRQPTGVFDAFIKPPSYPNAGAQVRVEYPFEKSSGSDDTELLDMTPATGSFGDAALLAGQTYTDSTYGITISVLTSTASALTVQVTSPGTSTSTVTQTTSLTPANYAAPVTFTATVTGTSITGTVSFTELGALIPGCSPAPLTGSSTAPTATCSTSSIIPGTHSIVAVYSGDSTHASTSSAVLTQVVNKAPSAVALASSLNPSLPATSVTFTATVTGSTPTGAVNFKDGATSLTGCSAVALTGTGNVRTATCSTSSLTGGTHTMTAVFAGDAINATSTSPVLAQGVGLAASTTGLASSANPAMFGNAVTFTATVNGNAPTGNVNFTDGGTSLSGCSAVALTGSGNTRTAACTAAALAAGIHNVVATYGGDGANVGSGSGTIMQAMAVPTTTTLATSVTPSSLGSVVTFTATVTGSAPTGSVSFTDGATPIAGCTAAAVTGSGNARTATCNTTGLASGSHSITAGYGGDAANIASTSPLLAQDVSGVASGAPTLQIAKSRKVHGAAGTFDLQLSLIPTNPSTEPRAGPAATVVLTFNKPLTGATVTVTEGMATAAAPNITGNDVVVDLTGVADQQYVTVSLSNVASADGSSGGSGSVRIAFLAGDVNQSRVVTLSDTAALNLQLAQPVTAANFLLDVNASGTLTLSDKGIAASNLTRALTAP
jgi:hypothetical protein